MLVEDLVEVRLWATHGRFPLQVEPEFVWTDFLWEWMSATWENASNIIADSDLQCVLPRPIRIPANNALETATDTDYDDELALCLLGDGIDVDLPDLTWTPTADHTMSVKYLPVWGQSTEIPLQLFVFVENFTDADTGLVSLEAPIDCNCFYAEVSPKSQPVRSLGAGLAGGESTTPDTKSWAGVSVGVGAGADEVLYRVRWMQNGDFQIEKTEPGGTDFQVLQTVPRPNSKGASESDYSVGPTDLRLIVEFRLLGAMMAIRVLDMGTAYVFPEDRGFWKFERALVEAEKTTSLTLEGREIRWARNFTADSPEVQIGFASSTVPTVAFRRADEELVSSTAGLNATNFSFDSAGTSLTGPTVRYRLVGEGPNDGEYKGDEYSNYGVGLRCPVVMWPGLINVNLSAPVYPEPVAVEVSHRFDPATLQFRSSAAIDINANKSQLLPTGEIGTWGQWMLNYGQVAGEILSSRTTNGGWMSAPALTFTGYGHTRGVVQAAQGGAMFRMFFSDRSIQYDSPRWALPWMDGWNMFYAMSFLAQLGGTTRDQLAFKASIPPSPFDDSLDEDGNPAPFLPYGPGGSIITRSSGETPRSIMARIAFSRGYMLGPNLYGDLDFRKFRIPAGTKRNFYESDIEAAQAGGGLEGAWNIVVEKDMSTVRSDTLVVGVEAFGRWNEILAFNSDPGVIYDPNAFNHLGYPMQSTWIDTQFANQAFADDASAAVQRWQRVPDLSASLTTWIQPDIYPLDVIMVDSPKCGTSAIRMLVLGVTHRQALGTVAATTIQAMHFVPDY